MKSIRRCLARLECCCPARRPPLHLYVACTDEQGHVVDHQSEAARPWVGRHYPELPGPVTVLRGVDPLQVLGRKGGNEG
jgi:hypothetical protein